MTLSWRDGQPTFDERVFPSGTYLRIEAHRFLPTTGELQPLTLLWSLQ